ncbi:hypothetical protein BGX26_009456 [Mortierella sp. AD094]|nr:hypothetical protein BGX26_009456 [Mortierella sp. AD094]
MDFARKSIMQHATASPKAAVRKINKVTADSNGKPSLTDLLAASEAEENIDSHPHPSKESSRQSFAKPDTPFTFESTPLPSLDTNAHRSSSSIFERNELKSLQPTTDQGIRLNPSNDSGLVESSVESGAQVRHAELDLQDSQATEPKAFDLKTALREDLARSRSNNAFLPRASIAHRAIPYRPPTVNERETLRSSRMAGFRARPLDPKVFTSAGDLGVPRVKKQPLTIPVSPVFSKPRVKATTISGPELAKTAASTRLANLIKGRPDRRPANHPQATRASNAVEGNKVTGTSTSATEGTVRPKSTLLSVPTVDQIRSIPNESKPTIQGSVSIFNARKTHTYPPNPVNQAAQERLFSGVGARKVIQGPPIRGEGPTSATTSKHGSDDHAGESSTTVQPLGASLIRRPLTRPVPFKFATDEILRKRHVMFQPKKTAEVSSTTTVPRESKIGGGDRDGITKSVKYPQPLREREQRMKMRESLERTFRGRPIKHYQPITIHKATKPLTKPVSPMIGEKRKRYLMEIQQEQEREQLEHSLQFSGRPENQHQHENNPISLAQRTSNITPSSYLANLGVDQEVYRQFEEGKILQEEHQEIQKQLTRQELRQLELANSARATIHQPPIRLSFPLDPELQDLQDGDVNAHRDANHNDGNQQPNVIPPLPPVRDSFGGSNSHHLSRELRNAHREANHNDDNQQPNVIPLLPPVRDSFGGSNSHHLSRELRRISLEASRGSSGGSYRKRLSDIGNRVSSGSGGSSDNRGSASGRTSLEGGAGSIGGYYPFTRSQAPTSSNTNTNETPTLSRPRAAEHESEDRRRSGSFIPLDATEPSKTISPSRTSRLSSGLFGATHYSSGKSLLNHNAHANANANAGIDIGAGVGVGFGVGSSSSLSRSRGPVVIEHTLTLSDL